ncbi:leucyl-tRNA--protein transferase [Treponema sp. R8-4-B8]
MAILNDTFNYIINGDIIITKNGNPDKIIDKIMGNTEYDELERGIGLTFSEKFIGDFMYSGFYITSDILNKKTLWFDLNDTDKKKLGYFPLLNIWKIQTVLFFDNLHISKSINRILKNYELRINYDFKNVLNNIIERHGNVWITPPLKKTLLKLNKGNYKAKAVSFEVYKNGELKAGEIGIITGKIYTSYSGFYNESSAGSVQLAMMLNYLKDNNFAFCNFGTDDSIKNNLYKRKLGSVYIDRLDFIRLWREGRR